MKYPYIKQIHLTICLLLSSTILFAQKFEVTPFYGYMFAGKMSVKEGDINIKNGDTFGILLDIPVQKGMMAEFSYSRLNTKAVLEQKGFERAFRLSRKYHMLQKKRVCPSPGLINTFS